MNIGVTKLLLLRHLRNVFYVFVMNFVFNILDFCCVSRQLIFSSFSPINIIHITISISYSYLCVIIITFVNKCKRDLLFHTLFPRMNVLVLCVSLLLSASPSKTDPLIEDIRRSAETTLFRINNLRATVRSLFNFTVKLYSLYIQNRTSGQIFCCCNMTIKDP